MKRQPVPVISGRNENVSLKYESLNFTNSFSSITYDSKLQTESFIRSPEGAILIMPAVSGACGAEGKSEMSSKLILVESTRSDPESTLLEAHEAEFDGLKQGPTKGGQTGSIKRREPFSVDESETRIACGGPPTVSDATGPDRSENTKSNAVQLMLLESNKTH